ncbi:MAG: GH-E family nuclease [Segniliparus sp.]|uniref:GH-E family nuclease n=1 Tax=Segniliparus sp. TaxID=2804064 RepID=UPI003F399B6F
MAVTPPDFTRAGKVLELGLGVVSNSFSVLVSALKAYKGMAGSDSYAHVWNYQYYNKALRGEYHAGGAHDDDFEDGLIDAATAALNAMGMMSDLLRFSGANHAIGDDPDAPAFPPGSHETIPVPYIPDAFGRTATAAPGWWPIIAIMVTGEEYPDGDVNMLREAGHQFRQPGELFRDQGQSACDAAISIVQQQTAPEVEGVVNWLTLLKAQLGDVADGFQALADGCFKFADRVEQARKDVDDKAEEELGKIAIQEVVFAALGPFTLGLSEYLGNARMAKRVHDLAEFVKTRLSLERIMQDLHDACSPMAAVAGGPAVQGINKLMPLLKAAPAIYMPAGSAEAATVGAALGLDRLVTKTDYRPHFSKEFEDAFWARAKRYTDSNGKEYYVSDVHQDIRIPVDGKYPKSITDLPKTENGRYYFDASTGTRYPVEAKAVMGHDWGQEAWRLRDMAIEKGWTMRQLKEELESHPEYFRVEDYYGNASHKDEMPKQLRESIPK